MRTLRSAFKRWFAGPDLPASNRRLAAMLVAAMGLLSLVAAATILLHH